VPTLNAGTNSAIEASLSAPGKIGGQGVGVGKRVVGLRTVNEPTNR
jgi:hypothetical protein